ncbi:glycerol kinase [Ereboglobus sp. PH5-10]|uniref:glycerol kinase GlpK n=1 Tax=Ereboglobus sp. PH5-10 TaxID=2940629 RepID=UPI002404D948|nr:glycerol kinase GlpK [Ereboglobus sp. PH5-10]MDF9827871.1 glycerol kinase [Ereboglobus sp. PH5-10]
MSSQKYILALDQGTTSSRAIVFDHSGRIVSVAQKEYRQHYPKSGWVEHDPFDIWASQSSTAAEAVSKADLSTDAIAAVGITNQRETTVVWDRETGKPVYNAIVWQDRRTADYCAELQKQGVESMIREKTGLRIDPYFSGTKIRWILENVDGARALADKGRLLFGTVDTWLIWQLTERTVHVTDATNASRTLLLNIHTGDWDDDLLKLLGIPRSMLPEVKSSSEVYGKVAPAIYPGGVPIAGIAGDQQAALFGQACFEPGMVKNTYGTGCFTLMNTGTEAVTSKNNLLTTIAWRIGNRTEYALEGSVFIGGAVVQWLRDELRIVSTAQEVDRLAATVPDAGGLYIVPAFTGLGAPHWDPYARGIAVGITRGTNRAHFCRAALDAIAFQTADLISCMEKDSGLTLSELRVDGGASHSQPLLQFQSDLLGRPVIRPECVETTAMGAAYLAGLAVGYWTSRDDITKNWQVDQEFKPDTARKDIDTLRTGWNRALERSKGWESGS